MPSVPNIRSMMLALALLMVLEQATKITPEAVAGADRDLFAPSAPSIARLSAADLRTRIHPFVGKGVVGFPGIEAEVSVTPDGAVLVPIGPHRLWFQVFNEVRGGFEPIFRGSSRSWPELRAPIVENKVQRGDLSWTQHVFATPEGPGRARLVVHVVCENLSEEHRLLGLTLGFASLSATAPPWLDKAQIPLPAPFIPNISRLAVSFQGFHLVPLPRLTRIAEGGLPEPWMAYRMALTEQPVEPKGKVEWAFTVNLWPEPTALPALDLERSLKETRQAWDEILRKAAEYSVPDLALVRIRNQLLVQLLLTSDNEAMMRAAFPSALATEPVGIQEAWAIRALAEWGLGFEATTLCDGTFFTEEFRAKDNRHHQYRAGATGKLAWDLYTVTGDRIWLKVAEAWLTDAANWIVDQTSKNQGTLPRYRFGLDIDKEAQAVWPNALAWRGLRDTALALDRMGQTKEAARLAKEAEKLRAQLITMLQNAPGRSRQTGYVPLRLDAEPSDAAIDRDYARFASLLLETGLLPPDNPETKDILRYLTATGRLQAGLAVGKANEEVEVFAPWSFGLQLHRLRTGDSHGFLLALYGMLALGMDADWFTAPESVSLMSGTEAEEQRKAQESRFALSTEPACALPAVVLLCLRRMFVYEETDETDTPTGVVRLLPATPDRWLAQAKPFYVKQLPTVCGKVSVVVLPEKQKITYRIRHHGQGVYPLTEFRLRIPPNTKNVSVTTGKAIAPHKDGWLRLAPAGEVVVVVTR